jgi:hypothetical protein
MAQIHRADCICERCVKVRERYADGARYRWLRDSAGNDIMRKLMKECRPEQWDKLVDEAMGTLTVSKP